MAPKKQQKKPVPKVYDYSGLEAGMRLQVEADGVSYAAEVVQVSNAKNRSKAPVKVSYMGYEGYDEWVGGDRIRSKALKVVKPEPKEKPASKPKATFKLNYFPHTALGEPIRMTLALARIPFEDDRVPDERWKDLKSTLPNNSQMPILHAIQGDSTEMMFQCRAILRYVGSLGSYKGTKLYPSAPKPRYYCDEVIEMIEDARVHLASTFSITDQAEKEAARAALVKPDGKMYPWLIKLNERLAKFPFAAGDKPSIADAYAVTVLFMFQQPTFLDGFPADTYKNMPNITALKDKFCALPPLQEYYKDAEGIRAPFKVAYSATRLSDCHRKAEQRSPSPPQKLSNPDSAPSERKPGERDVFPGAGAPAICPSLILLNMDVILMIPMSEIIAAHTGDTAELEILSMHGKSMLQAKVEMDGDGRKALVISSVKGNVPRVYIKQGRPGEPFDVIGPEEVAYGTFAQTGDSSGILSHLSQPIMRISKVGNLEMTATKMDNNGIANAAPDGDNWKLTIDKGADTVLICACMMSLILLGGSRA